MSGKRQSSSKKGPKAAPRAKKQRKAITIGLKLEVLNLIDSGERIADIGRVLDLTESTVRSIRDNADKIRETAQSGTSSSVTMSSYARSTLMGKMEASLRTWIEEQNLRKEPVSVPSAQAKARTIYEELAKDVENAKAFNASLGWFCNFKKRYNFQSIKMASDASSDDNFIVTLKAIEEGGYSLCPYLVEVNSAENGEENTGANNNVEENNVEESNVEEKRTRGKRSEDKNRNDKDVSKPPKTCDELAKKLDFEEVDLDDVAKLLDSQEENNQTALQLEKEHQQEAEAALVDFSLIESVRAVLTTKRLSEAFRLIEQGLAILDEDDPNTERSSRVSRRVFDHLTCYRDILKERKAQASQKSLLSYFKVKEGLNPHEQQPSTSSVWNAQQMTINQQQVPFHLTYPPPPPPLTGSSAQNGFFVQ